MVSRSDSASASRSSSLSRSRIASAPMPPSKYTPNPYAEPNRSLSSRKMSSSLTISLGASSRKRAQVSSSRRTDSTAASRASSRRDSMSRYISRTFSDHWMIASRSSFCIRPSAFRQMSLASSRISSGDSSPSALVQLLQQPVPELPRLVQVLRVDALDEHGVVAFELASRQQRVEHPVDVLRDRALLRSGRLLGLGPQAARAPRGSGPPPGSPTRARAR